MITEKRMRLNRFNLLLLTVLFCPLLSGSGEAVAQEGSRDWMTVRTDHRQVTGIGPGQKASPRGAFVRSLVLPGWGHFYAGSSHYNRGGIHLGSEAAFLGALVGFRIKSGRLENDYISFTRLYAGVDLSSRGRSFRLAVGDFNSLEEYNDYQLRSRNWDRVLDDTPGNRWSWSSAEERLSYRDMRSYADRIRNQLPAFAALMVVNRVVSAVSAYNRVKKENEKSIAQRAEISILPVMDNRKSYLLLSEMIGLSARVTVHF